MRNYISVNAKYYKMGEIDRISNHNFRQSKIDYLLPKEQIKFENKNIVFDENFQATKQDLSLENLDFAMRGQFTKLLELKKNILKKNNAKHRKNENQLIEMVVALSEEQAKFYLENGVDLMAGFENFAKNIEAKHGLKPFAISLHLDEGNTKDNVTKVNVHAHLTFFNYNFKKEKSVLRTLQKQDFKEMQDIAANSFQNAGLNFIRGESKELSGKKHLERNDLILANQKQQLESYDLILKSLIPNVNEEKKDLKALLNTFNKDSVEYNLLYNLIGSTITLEKELRKYSKIEDFNKENKDEIIKLLKRHLEKVEPLVGKDFYKLENSNALIYNLEEFVQKISNVNLEFTENQEKDKVIKDLELKLKEKDKIIEDKDSVIEKVTTEKYEAIRENKILKQNDISKTNEMTKLKENHTLEIKRLQNDFKRQNRVNIRRRNNNRLLAQKIMRDNNLKSIMQIRKFLRNNKNIDLNKNKTINKKENYDLSR